jgi:phenylpyruvate tautomerase PptA (4-oxalocrotonate tautomerase family)
LQELIAMPILDIEIVQPDGVGAPAAALTQSLADAAGRALGSAPGRTWVRLRTLAASHYAENEATLAAEDLPVFVTVLYARSPQGEALATEVQTLTQALAASLSLTPQRVHVQIAPAAAGRQAFGGELVK